jgi:hypothetical protein
MKICCQQDEDEDAKNGVISTQYTPKPIFLTVPIYLECWAMGAA